MRRFVALAGALVMAGALALAAQQPKIRIRTASVSPGGGGEEGQSLVEQGVHPRTAGLSSATISSIATKINAYYDDNPTTTYSDIVGSFGDMVAELDANFSMTANQSNALAWAPAYCLVGHVLPSLTTGGATGINPSHTATQYGQEGARLAAAITNLEGVDGGFPYGNAPLAYDWCHAWLSSGNRSTIRAALDDFESVCDSLYASYFAADSHKNCHAMFVSAVAVAGDDGETWGSNILTEYVTKIEDSSTGIIGSESRVMNLYKSTYGYGACGVEGFAYDNYKWAYDVLNAETYRFGATTQTRAQFYDLTKYSWLPSAIYCWVNNLRPFARTLATGIEPHDKEWMLARNQFVYVSQMDPNDIAGTIPAVFAGIWNEVETAPAQLAMWYVRNRLTLQAASGGSNIGNYWIRRFTTEDPTITPQSPTSLSLPVSARFGDGRYVLRSAWDGDSTTNVNSLVFIHLPEFSVPGNGREAMNMSGAFEVHRKGPQMIMRGPMAHVKTGHGVFNTLYFMNTSRTTAWANADEWSANTDGRPLGWTTQPQADDRGADIVQGGNADYYDDADLRHVFASGNVTTDYIYADRSRTYACACKFTNATNPAVVTSVKSQYINFRPAAATGAVRLAIYHAYTNTSNQYAPTFAWNPSTESITVNGSTSAGAFHGQATHGHLKTTNSTIATASNTATVGSGPAYSGRNTLNVVRPTSVSMVIAGGPSENATNFAYTDGDGGYDELTTPTNATSLEHVDLFGFRHNHNNTNASDVDHTTQQGRYVLQVQPTTIPNGAAGDFLMLHETDDAGSTAATVTSLTSLTNFVGFQWRDTDMNGIAVFGAAGADQTSGAFTIPTAGTYTAVIANLSGATRTFSFAASCGTMTNLADGDTDLTFTVSSGKTITATIVTSGSNCAVTIS